MVSTHSTSEPPVLANYKFFPLPNLSTLRNPKLGREIKTITVPEGCTELIILTALGKCIGAYCSMPDVLLGWHASGRERAARIRFDEGLSWEQIMQNAIVADISQQEIHRLVDEKNEPFVAILSQYSSCPEAVSLEVSFTRNHVVFTASTKYFHQTTLTVLAKQVQAVITRISTAPGSSHQDLSFMPVDLTSCYDGAVESELYSHIPPVSIVTDYIAHYAHAAPNRLALECYSDLKLGSIAGNPPETLSYADLHSRSNQFAHYLVVRDLAEGDRVAISLPRCVEFHICMLGILKAGCCYVPIDPELPPERISFIIEDSQAKLVLDAATIATHMAKAIHCSLADLNMARREGLAYMLYTSGTTGTPKGCLLTHEGLAGAILALSWFAFTAAPDGRYLAVASIAFDVHIAETFVPLCLGMALVTAPRSQIFEDLPRWLMKLNVTHVGIVPSLIEATMCAVEEFSRDRGDDEWGEVKLRYIASGGEKMSDYILDRWAGHPQVRLANFYGPSEVTIGCAARFMSSATNKENIGSVFANCAAYVVNESLEVVMRGAIGELLLSGPLVGRGYHGKPDLTAKAFVEWAGKCVYRSGDLVRMMPDGTLEILGRIDTQIKLRGVRIESEGVSNIIRGAALSGDLKLNLDVSTVLARHPLLQTDQLVAFFSWDPSVNVTYRRSSRPKIRVPVPHRLLNALKEACGKELASYMRPAHIIPLDFLPLNANGKVDNKALVSLFEATPLDILWQATASDGAARSTTSSAPIALSTTERTLAKLMAIVTPISHQLEPSSSVFELGYDSMKLIRLAASIRSKFDWLPSPISISDMMKAETLGAIASLIEEASCQANRSALPESSLVQDFSRQWTEEVDDIIGPGRAECILPTFPVQDGVLYRSMGSNELYVQHVILKLCPELSLQNLKAAWNDVMSHHQILRTIFLFSKEVIQVVLYARDCQLPWREQSFSAEESNFTSWFLQNEAPAISRAITRGMESVPPFRLLVYTAHQTHYFALSIHHSIFDGISLPLLLRDVEDRYLGHPLTSSTPLAQVLEHVHRADTDKARDFWRDTFEGVDWTRTSHRLASGSTARDFSHNFDAKLATLESLAANANVTLQALLTAAYAVCLRRYLYEYDDIIFGVIRSGRSALLGQVYAQCPMISILPTRIDVSQVDLLRNTQRNIANAIEFEHTPLGKAQYWLQAGTTLFETLFSISFKDIDKATLWQFIRSTQPQPDYFLAVEVVVDPASSQVTAQAAFCPEDISFGTVSCILNDIEDVAISLARGILDSFVSSIDAEKPGQGQLNTQVYGDNLEAAVYLEESPDLDLENRMRAVIAQFLGLDLDCVHSCSSLVSLGLESIKSMGLSRRLRMEGIEVTAVELLQCHSVRNLISHQRHPGEFSLEQEEATGSALLEETRRAIEVSFDLKSTRFNSADLVTVYPTTALQSGMLSQTISSEGQLYVHTFIFKLSDKVDHIRLKISWWKAIQSFAILRTSFHFLSSLGCWVQVIHSDVDMQWTDAHPSEPDMKEVCDPVRFSTEEAFARPPISFLLQNSGISGQCPRLILKIHHALYDGVSMQKLTEAVKTIYHLGQLSHPAQQFHDLLGHFEYQQSFGTNYWARQLTGYVPNGFTHKNETDDWRTITTSLDVLEAHVNLGSVARLVGATPQCFAQAAWVKTLIALNGTLDVVFGHVVSGRNISQAEDVIGPMLNTIPCRVRLSAKAKNEEALRSIHQNNIEALTWQHAALRSIQKASGYPVLWDSIFSFQGYQSVPEEKNDLWELDVTNTKEVKTQYALSIEVRQFEKHLTIAAACRAGIMTLEKLANLLNHFQRFFHNMIHRPDDAVLADMPPIDELKKSIDFAPLKSVASHPLSTSSPTTVPQKDDYDKVTSVLSVTTKIPTSDIHLGTSLLSLGVDSVSAVQVAAKLRKLGLEISAAGVTRCDCVSDLLNYVMLKQASIANKPQTSDAIAENKSASILSRLGVRDADAVENFRPVTAGMKWLIGAWQGSRSLRFQHAFALRFQRLEFDEEKLKKAWQKLVERHDILRSTFANVGGSSTVSLVTFKLLQDFPPLTCHTLDQAAPNDDALIHFMKGVLTQPLSTIRPPCRAFLVNAPMGHFLLLHLHHFQYDAWSLPLLIDDLASLYCDKKPSSSNDLVGYLDHFRPNTSRAKLQEEYWTRHFPPHFEPKLFPPLNAELPLTHGRAIYFKRAALRDVSKMKEQALSLSVSLTSIFLACWARVQARYTGGSSATLGLWHSGRSGGHDDIERLAIPCMNVLPFYVPNISEDTHQVASYVQSALRNRTPTIERSQIEDIDRWVGGKGKPLCNVFVNIINDVLEERKESSRLFEHITVPYYVPEAFHSPSFVSSVDHLQVTNLIQDDLMIDIVASSVNQGVDVSIEYPVNILNEQQAATVVRQWAMEVQQALRIGL